CRGGYDHIQHPRRRRSHDQPAFGSPPKYCTVDNHRRLHAAGIQSEHQSAPTMGDNAVILIELSGAISPVINGLTLQFALADNCTVRGLVINSFQLNAIDINSNGNTIEGNFIGTNPAGTAALPNGASSQGGVIFVGASS